MAAVGCSMRRTSEPGTQSRRAPPPRPGKSISMKKEFESVATFPLVGPEQYTLGVCLPGIFLGLTPVRGAAAMEEELLSFEQTGICDNSRRYGAFTRETVCTTPEAGPAADDSSDLRAPAALVVAPDSRPYPRDLGPAGSGSPPNSPACRGCQH